MINEKTDPKAQEFASFLEERIKKLEASTSDESRRKIESTNDDFGNVLRSWSVQDFNSDFIKLQTYKEIRDQFYKLYSL